MLESPEPSAPAHQGTSNPIRPLSWPVNEYCRWMPDSRLISHAPPYSASGWPRSRCTGEETSQPRRLIITFSLSMPSLLRPRLLSVMSRHLIQSSSLHTELRVCLIGTWDWSFDTMARPRDNTQHLLEASRLAQHHHGMTANRLSFTGPMRIASFSLPLRASFWGLLSEVERRGNSRRQ